MAGPAISVLVFCGSRPGTNPAYLQAATDTGMRLAEAGHRLVYGAGDVGLMGAVATAAISAGGDTLGVIPTHLLPREGQQRDLSQIIITETMHERKKVMVMNSDAIVLLPGGAGSLDELFEVLTWAQLGLHAKPIFILNIAGYWDKLIALIEHVIGEEFADPSLRTMVRVIFDPDELIAELGVLHPPA